MLHRGEPDSAGGGCITSDSASVVLDAKLHVHPYPDQRNADPGRSRMPAGIADRLLHDSVQMGRFFRVVNRLALHFQLAGNRVAAPELGRELSQSDRQSARSNFHRMEFMGDGAHLAGDFLDCGAKIAQIFRSAHAASHFESEDAKGERHELLASPIVEILADPPALGLAGGEHAVGHPLTLGGLSHQDAHLTAVRTDARLEVASLAVEIEVVLETRELGAPAQHALDGVARHPRQGSGKQIIDRPADDFVFGSSQEPKTTGVQAVEEAPFLVEAKEEIRHRIEETAEASAVFGEAAEALQLVPETVVFTAFVLQGSLELRYGDEQIGVATRGSGMIYSGHFSSLDGAWVPAW